MRDACRRERATGLPRTGWNQGGGDGQRHGGVAKSELSPLDGYV